MKFPFLILTCFLLTGCGGGPPENIHSLQDTTSAAHEFKQLVNAFPMVKAPYKLTAIHGEKIDSLHVAAFMLTHKLTEGESFPDVHGLTRIAITETYTALSWERTDVPVRDLYIGTFSKEGKMIDFINITESSQDGLQPGNIIRTPEITVLENGSVEIKEKRILCLNEDEETQPLSDSSYVVYFGKDGKIQSASEEKKPSGTSETLSLPLIVRGEYCSEKGIYPGSLKQVVPAGIDLLTVAFKDKVHLNSLENDRILMNSGMWNECKAESENYLIAGSFFTTYGKQVLIIGRPGSSVSGQAALINLNDKEEFIDGLIFHTDYTDPSNGYCTETEIKEQSVALHRLWQEGREENYFYAITSDGKFFMKK